MVGEGWTVMTVHYEILGRLRRDIGRLDALDLIVSEIEDEETRERFDGFMKEVNKRTRLLNRDLNRIEKEILEISKE